MVILLAATSDRSVLRMLPLGSKIEGIDRCHLKQNLAYGFLAIFSFLLVITAVEIVNDDFYK